MFPSGPSTGSPPKKSACATAALSGRMSMVSNRARSLTPLANQEWRRKLRSDDSLGRGFLAPALQLTLHPRVVPSELRRHRAGDPLGGLRVGDVARGGQAEPGAA